jgi:hypothetical protein
MLERLPHRPPVLAHLVEVAEADRAAAGGGHAGDALSHRDLRPHAFRLVAPAGDGVEPLAALVGQHEQHVVEGEQLGQPVDGGRDQPVEIGAAAQPGGQLGEHTRDVLGAGTPAVGRVEGTVPGRDHVDVQDPVDVGPPQFEHVLHPVHDRHGRHVVVQQLEDAAAVVGTLVHHGQPVLVVGGRVGHQDAGPGVLGQVARGLGEELVGQRHPLGVHHPHL